MATLARVQLFATLSLATLILLAGCGGGSQSTPDPSPGPPPPVTDQITVTLSGTGSGVVTSTPAGISCGTTCTATFTRGTSVQLAAVPSAGSTFTGWTGA